MTRSGPRVDLIGAGLVLDELVDPGLAHDLSCGGGEVAPEFEGRLVDAGGQLGRRAQVGEQIAEAGAQALAPGVDDLLPALRVREQAVRGRKRRRDVVEGQSEPLPGAPVHVSVLEDSRCSVAGGQVPEGEPLQDGIACPRAVGEAAVARAGLILHADANVAQPRCQVDDAPGSRLRAAHHGLRESAEFGRREQSAESAKRRVCQYGLEAGASAAVREDLLARRFRFARHHSGAPHSTVLRNCALRSLPPGLRGNGLPETTMY